MTRAVESPGEGFPHLAVAWPGTALVAGITTRAASAPAEGRRDPALDSLRTWGGRRFAGLVGGAQVHGARVFVADGAAVPGPAPHPAPPLLRKAGYDGFLATGPGMLLTVEVADCVPALLHAPGSGAVALLHAGWRGIAAGILQAALAMLEERGIRPADVLAWWGPAVGPCCYPVGEEVVEAIRATDAGPGTEDWVRSGPGGTRVDLREALSRQAESAGVPRSAITASPHCTSCSADLFFSQRREPGGGRMIAFAGLPLTG